MHALLKLGEGVLSSGLYKGEICVFKQTDMHNNTNGYRSLPIALIHLKTQILIENISIEPPLIFFRCSSFAGAESRGDFLQPGVKFCIF